MEFSPRGLQKNVLVEKRTRPWRNAQHPHVQHSEPREGLGPETEPEPAPQAQKGHSLGGIEIGLELGRLAPPRGLDAQCLMARQARRQILALRLEPRPALNLGPPPRYRVPRKLLAHRNPVSLGDGPSLAVQAQALPAAGLRAALEDRALAAHGDSVQNLKMAAVPKARRPQQTRPAVDAEVGPHLLAVQDAAVCHPLKSGIAIEQVLQHLPGIVVVLLPQVDAQPGHAGKNHLARHA